MRSRRKASTFILTSGTFTRLRELADHQSRAEQRLVILTSFQTALAEMRFPRALCFAPIRIPCANTVDKWQSAGREISSPSGATRIKEIFRPEEKTAITTCS